MLGPGLSPKQDRSGALDEQGPQIAVSPLRYAREDRSIASRYLFGHEAKPRGKIAASRKGLTSPNRSDHCTRCDWPDAGRTHEAAAMFVPVDEGFKLRGNRRNTCLEVAPVPNQLLDEPKYAWRKSVRTCRQNLRES